MIHYWPKGKEKFICGKIPKPGIKFTCNVMEKGEPAKITCPTCIQKLAEKGIKV